jgi:hypothetical protein
MNTRSVLRTSVGMETQQCVLCVVVVVVVQRISVGDVTIRLLAIKSRRTTMKRI